LDPTAGTLARSIFFAVLLAAAFGCRPAETAQSAFDKVTQELDQGDVSGALRDINKAFESYGGETPEWNWRFRVLKAQILVSAASPKEALALLAGELPSDLQTKDVAVRRVLVQGVAYRYAQEFQESEQKLAEAQRLAASYQPQLTGQILIAQGVLEIDEHEYAKAESTLRHALGDSRQQKNGQQEARALVNLARLSILEGHFTEGIDQSQAALGLSRSLHLQSTEATLLGNLGWCNEQLGDFENAVDFFKQAAESSRRLGLTGNNFYWQGTLAQAYQELRDYDSAQSLLQTTVENARRLDSKQTLTENLNALVRLALKKGHVDLAQQYIQEALQVEQSSQDHSGSVESHVLSARIAAANKDYTVSEMAFREVLQDPHTEIALRWEAEKGMADVHEAQGRPGLADREYQQALRTFGAARSTVDRDDLRLSFFARGIELYSDYIEFLIAHHRPDDALRVAELSRALTLAEGLGQTQEHGSAPRSQLQPQQLAGRFRATLLFYWLGENRSYLWAITPTNFRNFQLPPASEIDSLVKAYRQAQLDGRDVLESSGEEAQKLYKILIEPARKLISPVSRVIVLPDSSLYSLNFETLIVPDPQPHFWIEDVTVTTANSLTLLAAAAARPATKEKKLLLIGDASQASAEFPALRQAPQEIGTLEKYFPEFQRTLLVKDKATPTAYLASNPGNYAYLHFVTHGTASRARPLESAVILSREKNDDSFKLYARDIVQHHLNAQLVTISACNGSGTRAYSGEGLVGLSWAFLRAGAHNVIGALWEVSDASTPQLMDTLYNGLSHGDDPATALRNAKLAFLHSDSPYKKPYYWAPFQLYSGS
jgi:CHAT domain-containing protein